MQYQPVDIDVETVHQIVGPTPSVGGMILKLLVVIPDTHQWHGESAPPGTQCVEHQRYVDVLLKVEPNEYQGVIAFY
ncbi:MAG: hypothetical protein OEY38_14750 [Gammaproteobacteria bacterium]|nr:hypothetical protein [Gammaproteobacteria bacterium]